MPRNPKNPKKRMLPALDKEFAAEYARNGGNGKRAYLAIHPHAAPSTATKEASLLVSKRNVREEILSQIARKDSSFNPETVSARWAELYAKATARAADAQKDGDAASLLGVAAKAVAGPQRLLEKLLPQAVEHSADQGGVVGALAALARLAGGMGNRVPVVLDAQATVIPSGRLGSEPHPAPAPVWEPGMGEDE